MYTGINNNYGYGSLFGRECLKHHNHLIIRQIYNFIPKNWLQQYTYMYMYMKIQ
jgi:hypothetical protein